MDSINFLGMAAACLLKVYFICFGATQITNESQKVFDAIYQSNWYETDANQRRGLIMIMMRSRIIGYLQAGFVDLSLETFQKVRLNLAK